MIRLTESLGAFGTTEFESTVKKEIQNIEPHLLPLQKGLSQSSYVSDRDINIMILKIADENDVIIVKTGINYSGVIAGSCCADDPTPMSEQNEYCELQFIINKSNAETTIVFLDN